MERKEVIERCGKERGRTGCFGTREVRGEQKKRSPASLRGHCKLARVHSLSDLAGTRLLSRFMNRLYGSHVPAECGDRYCTACVCVCVSYRVGRTAEFHQSGATAWRGGLKG